MSEIKALNELRILANNNKQYWWSHMLLDYLDSAQAEIADNYMRLPCDADGVPWNIGEEVDGCEIVAMNGYQLYYYDDGSETVEWCIARNRRHVKPRTLEDIVQDAIQYGYSHGKAGMDVSEQRDKYADEIRELLLCGEGDKS